MEYSLRKKVTESQQQVGMMQALGIKMVLQVMYMLSFYTTRQQMEKIADKEVHL